MTDYQIDIQTEEYLKNKYNNINPNAQKNIKIEQLIKTLDQLVIDFNQDLAIYNKIKDTIKEKSLEFTENSEFIPKNVYVGNIPNIDLSLIHI